MKLKELLQGVTVLETNVPEDLDISGVAYDSRKVRPDGLFVAISGFAADGNRFIPMALEKGAAAVVTAKKPGGDVPYVLVESDRHALAMIGINFYGRPAEKMTMIGVTGTNGKTSTTMLLKQVLEKTVGAKVGLVGTMENLVGDEVIPTERTTPESFELQGLFARMRDAGCTHVVMEVSSHAIVLDRVGGIHFDVAAFTNLTEDHLDFHKTMEAYRDAKALLFHQSKTGVTNLDDAAGKFMLEQKACPFLSYGEHEACDLRAADIQLHADSIGFVCESAEGKTEVKLGIPGQFTVYNALCALSCAKALGVSVADAADALHKAHGVKGRVEVVPTNTDYTVLIDYAHSPDGVENVLEAARVFTKGRVIGLFGCGGDRDRTKRPKMGAIAAKLSDYCIVTSDNPRTEKPEAIIEDILEGMKDTKTPYDVIVNRPEAIWHALDIAQTGDTIVLMGKGHETYQEINHVKHHLDEREVVAQYFENKNRK